MAASIPGFDVKVIMVVEIIEIFSINEFAKISTKLLWTL